MNYIVLHFKLSNSEEYVTDLLSALLGEIGFESFDTDKLGLNAYIPEDLFEEKKVKEVISEFPLEIKIKYEIEKIDRQNWNEKWEKHFFEPIIVANKCVVHSSFHTNIPNCNIKIVIDPKMSFGTGHHETTQLMMETILEIEMKDKIILDMGCGTSVLAILASKLGAKTIDAIDIDDWCVDNSKENLKLNNIHNIDVFQGTSDLLNNKNYDIIFANINRNILLNDIPQYSKHLSSNGLLLLSGFYTQDINTISEKAIEHNLHFVSKKELNNWNCLVFKKE